MTLIEFFQSIDEQDFTPEIYIVRLQYKYVYEDKLYISNEILQYDPSYRGFVGTTQHPWYHECWLWYSDWYMCVDPASVKVIYFANLEEVFDGKET